MPSRTVRESGPRDAGWIRMKPIEATVANATRAAVPRRDHMERTPIGCRRPCRNCNRMVAIPSWPSVSQRIRFVAVCVGRCLRVVARVTALRRPIDQAAWARRTALLASERGRGWRRVRRRGSALLARRPTRPSFRLIPRSDNRRRSYDFAALPNSIDTPSCTAEATRTLCTRPRSGDTAVFERP